MKSDAKKSTVLSIQIDVPQREHCAIALEKREVWVRQKNSKRFDAAPRNLLEPVCSLPTAPSLVGLGQSEYASYLAR